MKKIIRKIKDKIKAPAAKKAPRKLKAKSARPQSKTSSLTEALYKAMPTFTRAKTLSNKEPRKEIHGIQEMAVGSSKFYTGEAKIKSRRIMPQELPGEYGVDKIVLMVRDPWWLYTYWEVAVKTMERIKGELGDLFFRAKRLLRVYDVTQIQFDGNNAHRYFDVQVNDYASSWYIESGAAGRSWCVDFGLLLPDGRFITIVRSNIVQSPIDGPSGITDEEWMIPEEIFARLYGMGFGFGKTSPTGKAWQERLRKALFSGILASPGITSVSSPGGNRGKARKFWLVVDCELIVYGATEPDADVSVQGKKINLRPDGTFTMRYALPDGTQVIPVKAVSSDKLEERTITPTVSRQTKSSIMLKEEANNLT